MTEAVKNPLYNQVEFMCGVAALSQLPPDIGKEVAFSGRSNAGKSSVLNATTGRRSLARVSKTPGRTRQLNFFRLDGDRRLVDLPGYGYAKVSQAERLAWSRLLERYLNSRVSLQGVVLVMDVRHPLTVFDQNMINWCGEAGMPLHILMTKVDKLSRGAASAALHQLHKSLEAWAREGSGPVVGEVTAQLFSAVTGVGVEQLHQRLDAWLDFRQKKTPVS